MAYFKPYIDESGLHYPSYTDIRDHIVSRIKAIYGDDVYLEPDSQDYQMLSVYADIASDTNSLLALDYNNRGPGTATGGGLSGLVKLNGIRRKGASHSHTELLITGTPGTIISNGKAGDSRGQLWTVQGTVIIPDSGTVKAEAVCDTIGAVSAEAGSINRIMTNTLGWISCINPASAVIGQDMEVDSALRARQTISVARPSRTVFMGTLGAVAEIVDVTRSKGYENDKSDPDEHGIPGHHISLIIEGGDPKDIAEAIYWRKTPGTGTFGDIEVAVTEEMEQTPLKVPPIRFFRPQYIDVYVIVSVRPKAGYVSQTTEDIASNVQGYLNSLEIGADLVVSALYAPILSATTDITAPSFSVMSVLIGKTEEELAASDIPIAFNEVTRGIDGKVKVVVQQ